MEWVLPVNRSGWAIAAGYVALFNFPFVFLAPISLVLGIIALVSLKHHPGKRGYGRAIFAIVYGLAVTIITTVFIVLPLLNN